ncbi:heme exporter protein CcmB [Methanohalobium sp.]|uniref:heme exporter protein CcmB n=1 Tax=Methanohalobium sp. TaxID=2837493 RepID=UPI0025D75CE2|nr:heme exporter protein CcmB [Methanohalobium sp.]
MIQSLRIALKDLKSEFRTKQMLNSMLVFSLIVIVIFSISFGNLLNRSQIIGQLAPGVLWISFTFAGTLGLSRSFAAELENGCLDGLKLCSFNWNSIYIGKMLSSTILMITIELIIIPLFIVFFNFNIQGIHGLFIILVLGTIGYISVGTLLSALTVNIRTREILLPVLLLPLIIPILLPAVLATGKLFSGGNITDVFQEIRLLIVYDIIFFVIAQLVFEYAIQD